MNNLTLNKGGFQPANQKHISLDFVSSNDASEIDRGIRETIMGIRLSVLALSLGLVKMKTNNLFKKLGYKNISQYVESLANDYKVEQNSIYRWLRIGKVYVNYGDELENVGFTDSDGVTKLPYLERALALHEREDVFENLKAMSLSEFRDYAKGEEKKASADMPFVKNKGSVIYIAGQRAVIINKNLPEKTAAYIQKIVKTACEALDNRGVIVPIFVRNMKDGKKFQRAAEQLKVKMGLG